VQTAVEEKEGPIVTAAELLHDSELTQVERWRIAELERAGYEPHAAKALGSRLDVDLHRAVDLVRRGCAPELALQILL
jgi:hypothetical protein